MVPFFIQIKSSGKSKSDLYVLASGSENMFGWDFGKNKKIVNKILDFSNKRAKLEITDIKNIPKDKIRCIKCSYENSESVLSGTGHCEKCDASLPTKEEMKNIRMKNKFVEELNKT